MWPKSNNIAVFALDLESAYEGEHMIFGLLKTLLLTELSALNWRSQFSFEHALSALIADFAHMYGVS
jgi:hypothetical protein